MQQLKLFFILALFVMATTSALMAEEICIVTQRPCDGSLSKTVDGTVYYFSSKGAQRLFELRTDHYVNKSKGLKTCPVTGAKGTACPAKKTACPSTCDCSSKVPGCTASCTHCPSVSKCKTACDHQGCECGCGCEEQVKKAVKKTVKKAVKTPTKKVVTKCSFSDESSDCSLGGCPADKSLCGGCKEKGSCSHAPLR